MQQPTVDILLSELPAWGLNFSSNIRSFTGVAVWDSDFSSNIRTLTIVSALIVHQVFRRFETYLIRVHALLLFGPPALIIAYDVMHNPETSIFSSTVTCFFTYFLTLLASVVMYRLSPFHPLAGYPGPLINRVSKFWMAYHSLDGIQGQRIKALHEKYGDIVRTGPNELFIRDPALIQPLLGSGGVPKGPHYYGHTLSSDSTSMITLQDTDEHLRRRRPWQRAFKDTKNYENQIGVRANQVIEALEKEMHGPISLEKHMEYFAYNFMFDTVFGDQDLLSDKENEVALKLLSEHVAAAFFLSHIPWIGDYLGSFPPIAGQVYRIVAYCYELTKKRLARGTKKKDLFSVLSNQDIPNGQPPPFQQLVEDGFLAITGGSDTTASAMSNVFACLMEYPEVYAKVQAEVDRFYPPGDSPYDSRHYHDMHYLNAVINETLRVLPPVHSGSQRQVPHKGPGVLVESTYIPPGTILWVHAYSAHLDARNFSPAPETFWPERWLIGSGVMAVDDPTLVFPTQDKSQLTDSGKPVDFVHNEAAFLPFSYGPMNCVGKALALQEVRSVVCAILQRFHLRPTEGWTLAEYARGCKDYLVSTRGELSVLLEVREGTHIDLSVTE